MKHKTAELEGALLDAAVHRCFGPPNSTELVAAMYTVYGKHAPLDEEFHPSAEWRHGCPIIERERIAPQPQRRGDIGNEWADRPEPALGWEVRMGGRAITGPTYLIAAMRAYVASKLGDEVELP